VNGFHGALNPSNPPTWTSDAYSGSALDFNPGAPPGEQPIPDVQWVYVDANIVGTEGDAVADGNAISVSAWVKARNISHGVGMILGTELFMNNGLWGSLRFGILKVNFDLPEEIWGPLPLGVGWPLVLLGAAEMFDYPGPPWNYLEPPPSTPLIEADGQWYHIAFTYEATPPESFIELYVNGWPAGIKFIDPGIPAHNMEAGPCYIGSALMPFGPIPPETMVDYMDGIIDEVKIYDRKLSWGEIVHLSGGDTTPVFNPLESIANVYPTGYPEIIDFYDYAVITDEPTWMTENYWP
jgi:hypothetical protein